MNKTTPAAAPPTLKRNPRPLHVLDPDPADIASARRLHCASYDACLDRAILGNWPSFHCGECTAYQPQSVAEERRDEVGLVFFHNLPEHAERVRLNRARAERRECRLEARSTGTYADEHSGAHEVAALLADLEPAA